MNLTEILNDKAKVINSQVQQLITIWNLPQPLKEAIQYVLEAGGKRIRPILTLFACEAVNGKIDSVMQAAVAIELIHNASLLWDDVIDQDELRRGRLTVHKRWNKNIAILAGGILASKALELIKPDILDLYLKALGKMIEGQVMDISNSLDTSVPFFESKNEKEIFEILRKRFQQKALEGMEWEEGRDLKLISQFTEFEEERDYFEMISYKTSALIKLATRIGAFLGGGTEKEIEVLSNYGFYLGLAFQVRDDLIGLISPERVMGKPLGSDLRQGKLNLYTIFALRNLADNELREFLELIRKIDNPVIFQKTQKILEECGALDYVKSKIQIIALNARNQLSSLHNSPAKDILNQLITFTIEREF